MGPPRSAVPWSHRARPVPAQPSRVEPTRRGSTDGLRFMRILGPLPVGPRPAPWPTTARARFDPDRPHVVPWGSRPVRARRRRRSVRRRHGPSARMCCSSGTVEPCKGLPVLTDALARLRSAGADPRGRGSRRLGSCPRWGAGNGARPGRPHRIPERRRPGCAGAGASVCCLPSFARGSALPALEALAAGTPVVTTAGTALAEVVGARVLVPRGSSGPPGRRPASGARRRGPGRGPPRRRA